jgi:hypothetical protein
MVMPKGKYHREYAADIDKQQARLDPNSPSFLKEKKKAVISIIEVHTGVYRCPFCLNPNKINAYLISTKKGYDKRLGHCPACNNNMMIKTLTSPMTPEQFADFVFDYSRQGFWQKVKFKEFNDNLYRIGWPQRFWTRYKELKGDSVPTENYADYIIRVQEEEAREQGLIP